MGRWVDRWMIGEKIGGWENDGLVDGKKGRWKDERMG